ncbi:PH domain-containing protein [Periweissella cryptocerci]|nr:PH domain-containing protein [Periweissella cryptocerci]
MENSQPLPQLITRVWLQARGLVLIFAIAFLAVLLVLVHVYLTNFIWLAFLLGGLAIIGALVDLALIPYHYRFWRYLITDDFVFIQSGYFFRTQQTIPMNRVQNVDLNQGPLLRLAHLKELEIVTAANSFTIDAVTEVEANQLRNQLIATARKARDENA